MKLSKKLLVSAAALLLSTSVFAQQAALHGYMDYSNYGVGQNFTRNNTQDKFDATEPTAQFGSWYSGRTEVSMWVNFANVDFTTAIRLGAGMGTWYDLYRDETNVSDGSYFMTSNVKIRFLSDQLNFYFGKFEEWNNGFILGGYQLGGQKIQDLAIRGAGQLFTGVEWIPNYSVFNGALAGLRVMAGFPILPSSASYDFMEANSWDNLIKKIKIAASYKWMRPNILFTAGFRPGTYCSGSPDNGTGTNYNTNYFGEAYLQADLPSLIYGWKFNATYDIRWREAVVNNPIEEWSRTAFMHYFGISGTTSFLDNMLIMNFEDRFMYAGDHYAAINETGIFNQLGIGLFHNISGKPYQIGLTTSLTYAQDANGKLLANLDTVTVADYAMLPDAIDYGAMTKVEMSDGPARYYGAYAYPYFQKNFSNGYFKTGVEVAYAYYDGASDWKEGFFYRVPFAFCFWF